MSVGTLVAVTKFPVSPTVFPIDLLHPGQLYTPLLLLCYCVVVEIGCLEYMRCALETERLNWALMFHLFELVGDLEYALSFSYL